MNQNSGPVTYSQYSTIFNCQQGPVVCFLRLIEGILSLAMFVIFIRGFRAITKQRNNPLSPEDKSMYILSMAQTVVLAIYYLLFQEFFVLATIRNLLIWVNINFLEVLGKIYFLNDQKSTNHLKYAMNTLRILNFITWFVFSVGDGSSLQNTSFNLGYNCKVMDWVIISSFLLLLTIGQLYFGAMIIDKLDWQIQNNTKDEQATKSRQSQKQDILFLVASTLSGAVIMFVWDYIAFVNADTDSFCVEIFSGNTFFRKFLCFLLKLISMQLFPCLVYYRIYFKRRTQFLYAQQTAHRQFLHQDFLDNDAYSQLNKSLTSRVSSRGSLFSRGSQQNL